MRELQQLAPEAEESSAIFHPLSIVRMLWKHKALVVVVWGVLSVVGALVVSRLPDVYRAESLILVDTQKISEKYVESTVQVSLQDHLTTISQQILSATQLEKLIEKFNLYPKLRKTKSPEQVIEQMRSDVDIKPEKGWDGSQQRPASGNFSGAFRVAYEGSNPTVVAAVVNEISGLFIAGNLRSREMRAEGTSDFIESQLQEARKSLEKQEANLSQFKMARMGELPEQQAALIGTLARLHSELQGNQDAINRAEQNKVMLDNTLRLAQTAEAAVLRAVQQAAASAQQAAATANRTSAPRTDVTPAATVVEPPLRSRTLQTQLEALRLRYQDEHPEIKRMKLELEAALKQEAQELAAQPKKPVLASGVREPAGNDAKVIAPSVSPQMDAELSREQERVQTTRTQLAIAAKELDARVADRQRILNNIADYQAKVERLPMREQELAAVTRDYEISKSNYKTLLDKKISAEMSTDMERRQQAAQFTVQDPARVPSKPIKPKRMAMNGGAVGVGLVVGLLCALVIEVRKNRFLGEWELPANVKVLGRVPMIVIGVPVQAKPSGAIEGSVTHV